MDTGGTFTDVVVLDERTGARTAVKTPSTPDDPARAFVAGVRAALERTAREPGDGATVAHGTTVATNRLLEGRIGDLGLITNEGYRYILEIARQSVPDGYGNSFFWVKPDRIVPVHRVKTVPGRLDAGGNEVAPFDDDAAADVARWFAAHGVRAIGVCLLHSYADPAHEQRMREVLTAEHPDAVVSLSSDVLREYREYERTVTTLVDAAVKPVVADYLAALRARLADLGLPAPHVMKSDGGAAATGEVAQRPISTVLSGPAAGVLGAARIASAAGWPSALTLDGGGTSTDVSLVTDGEPAVTTEGTIGAYPIKIPMVDVATVGAGGGSVAWRSAAGTLKVGPRSAGADPGPICYGRGGTEVTVTDACAALGLIPPRLIGGGIELDVPAARDGIARLAAALGIPADGCAAGIMDIHAWNQANAIRQVTVRRGADVRELPMVVFGGSGPLTACALLDRLGLPAVLVPRDPGNLSAYGLLTVDVTSEHVQTAVASDDALDLAATARILADMRERAARSLRRQGFAPGRCRYRAAADLRYAGQAYEVRVELPGTAFGADARATTVRAFHDAHERLYGYCYRDDPVHGTVEWVNLRVTGIGPIERPPTAEWPGGRPPAPHGTRRVYLGADWHDAAVYRRDDLPGGATVTGPAVIEEYGSTLPLLPGYHAEVDRHGHLRIVGVNGTFAR